MCIILCFKSIINAQAIEETHFKNISWISRWVGELLGLTLGGVTYSEMMQKYFNKEVAW